MSLPQPEHMEHNLTTTPLLTVPPTCNSILLLVLDFNLTFKAQMPPSSRKPSQITLTPLENKCLGLSRDLKVLITKMLSSVWCCHTASGCSLTLTGKRQLGNKNQVCKVTTKASSHLPLRPLACSPRARSERLAVQNKCVSFASCFKRRTNSPFGHFHSSGNSPAYSKPSSPAQPD